MANNIIEWDGNCTLIGTPFLVDSLVPRDLEFRKLSAKPHSIILIQESLSSPIMEIKKAIIPIAGLGTRFLPLSKIIPKELFPLLGKPIIQYALEEIKKAGIKEIILIVNPRRKLILDYLKRTPDDEKTAKKIQNHNLLKEIKNLEELLSNFSVSVVYQAKPLGTGHALLQTKKIIGEEPVAVVYCDDVIDSKIPSLQQLVNVFKTSQRPTIALKKIPKENESPYGIVEGEKISSRLYKIKKFFEKPLAGTISSDLTSIGRYLLTPEVFEYLRKIPFNGKKELGLTDAFIEMLKDGKIIYGQEIEGEWLECGDKDKWIKSSFILSSKQWNH